MARIVVLGGSIIGLSMAMLLARQGHDITVLERDGDPVPGSPRDAWHAWDRRGIAQFHQPHFLHSGGRQILDAHLPEVKAALLAAGGLTFDMSTLLPPRILDRAPRAGDGRFVTVTGRRPTIEYAFARAACDTPHLRIVRGTTIVELLTGASAAADRIPHITGVRTLDGEALAADLVIDAMGRNSKLADWLEAAGARRPVEQAEESSFLYYTRYFRATTGAIPPFRSGIITDYHSFSLLTLPCDAQTWSVTVFFFSGDQPLKALRHLTRWTALVRACPLHAHWLDGEPISDVLAMGGITDRYRRFVVNGTPVATGVVSVGDAWGCTNPQAGRGITIGLMHAQGTAEVIQQHLDDPVALALAQDAMTEARLTPWYRDTVAEDRQRAAQFRATIEGRSVLPPTDPMSALLVGMMYDADLFRAYIETRSLLALPQEIMARPGMIDHIMAVANTHQALVPPCPSRDELLRLLA